MDGTVVGMSYGYSSDEYAHLWHFAMSPDDLKEEAVRIYEEEFQQKIFLSQKV